MKELVNDEVYFLSCYFKHTLVWCVGILTGLFLGANYVSDCIVLMVLSELDLLNLIIEGHFSGESIQSGDANYFSLTDDLSWLNNFI